jgi:hypothetical protein
MSTSMYSGMIDPAGTCTSSIREQVLDDAALRSSRRGSFSSLMKCSGTLTLSDTLFA